MILYANICFSLLDMGRAHVAFIFSELSQAPGMVPFPVIWSLAQLSVRATFSYLLLNLGCHVLVHVYPFFLYTLELI